jgi:Arginyl tRNA synthetase N terminal domain
MCNTSLPSTLIFSSSSSYLHFSPSYFSPVFFLFFLSSLTLLLQLGSLRSIFTAAIQKAFPQIITEEFGVGIITRCGNPSFGDFQCNNSLSISKYFKTLSGYSGKNILFLCYLLYSQYLFTFIISRHFLRTPLLYFMSFYLPSNSVKF